jgi:hypothetical protein
VANVISGIKDETIKNEVLKYFVESLLNIDIAKKLGFEDSTYHIFASMYTSMFNMCNKPCAGNALEFFADVCANFISNELQMNYSNEQIKFLSKLIHNCKKDMYSGVIAEYMNLNT